MPLNQKEFIKIVRKLSRKTIGDFEVNLAPLMSFQEIIAENDKLHKRIKEKVDKKWQDNYSASYHFCRGLL